LTAIREVTRKSVSTIIMFHKEHRVNRIAAASLDDINMYRYRLPNCVADACMAS
jgi:hypothetical protein